MSDFISEKMPQKKYYRDVPLRNIDSNQSMYSLIKNINVDLHKDFYEI